MSLNPVRIYSIPVVLVLSLLLGAVMSFAEGNAYMITISDHAFSPAELSVPANTKVKLVIENKDATPEEFESYDLNREKVVAGNAKITVFVGPLKPGRYAYFGEFHKDTAQGIIVVQ